MIFVYVKHASDNIKERRINRNDVENTILNPESISYISKGRKIAQKVIGNRLLRVIFKETEKAYIVITVYYTRIGRYQNGNKI